MIIALNEEQKKYTIKRGSKYKLSEREIEIFQKVLEGKANKDIAEECCITEKTVKFHVSHILKKTNSEARYQLYLALDLPWPTPIPQPA